MEHGIEKTMNMKLIICTFDQLFDFKINFHKSEIFYFGEAKDVKEHYLQLFGWEGGAFPFCYLSRNLYVRSGRRLNFFF
jgi:hypothetical protein